MRAPFFSVIIPLRALSHTLLTETLPALQKQKEKSFECIVTPNSHSHIDILLLKKYQWLRIIPSLCTEGPASKRNRGGKYAKGEVLAFIDDDAYPTSNWLHEAKQIWLTQKIAALGGPGILPQKSSIIENMHNAILISPYGSSSYTYRFVQGKKQVVDDCPAMNFFIEKKVFIALKGFQTNFWPGEDSKLCEDLQKKTDLPILYDPKVVVFHHRRLTILSFLRQHMGYGYHRGLFFGDGDTNSRKLVYILPAFGVLIFFFMAILDFASFFLHMQLKIMIFFIPLIVYFCFLLFHVLWSLFHKISLLVSIVSACILALLHFMYGIAFWVGLVKSFVKNSH